MNPQIKSGPRGGNRSFGLHGAGKGDGDRTADAVAYNENLDEVNFPRVAPKDDPSFRRTKEGRYVKVFGNAKEKQHEGNETWPTV